MSFTYEEWEKEFAPKLKSTRRWEGFSYLAKALENKQRLNIIEVGCIRSKDAWESDGQSTRVWNWMAFRTDGTVLSIEKESKNVWTANALCPFVHFVVGDGIETLLTAEVDNLDVLFLDAMDFTGPHAFNAWLQHVGFLAAAWPRLKPGTLIVVDDCIDDGEGKHVLIKDLFRRMESKPLVESYIHIWRKP